MLAVASKQIQITKRKAKAKAGACQVLAHQK